MTPTALTEFNDRFVQLANDVEAACDDDPVCIIVVLPDKSLHEWDGKKFRPVAFVPKIGIDVERQKCHDCVALEGELHEPGCDMERCPFCGGQLISCGCCYKHFYPGYVSMHVSHRHDYKGPKPKFNGLPEDVYNNGLSDKQETEWDKILEKKGRVPWIRYPNLCCRCGALWPEMFRISDKQWEKYVEPAMRREMICKECWEWIKEVIDEAAMVGR